MYTRWINQSLGLAQASLYFKTAEMIPMFSQGQEPLTGVGGMEKVELWYEPIFGF